MNLFFFALLICFAPALVAQTGADTALSGQTQSRYDGQIAAIEKMLSRRPLPTRRGAEQSPR